MSMFSYVSYFYVLQSFHICFFATVESYAILLSSSV